MLRERAINWHVSKRRGETLEIGSLFEGRQRSKREREREEERYVCIKDTSSTLSCLARVISLLEAKWGKLKAPYRRPLPVLLACWLPVSGCGTTRLENRVDGAPLNAPLFTNPPINRYYTRLSRDISSISIISILENRTFRGGAREKEKE